MSRKKRDQLKKSNFLVVKNNLDKTQDRIIFPRDVQVGIDNIDKGNVIATGRIIGKTGISGSLTRLSDGNSYLVAGNNITITSASNGQVTIASSGGGGGSGTPGGSNTQVQFNNAGSFDGDPNFTFDLAKDTLTVLNISGSLTRLVDGTSYIVGGNNIAVSSASNGQITISTNLSSFTRQKNIKDISTDTPFNTEISVPGMDLTFTNLDDDYVDVLLNGQYVISGSEYNFSGSFNSIRFSYDLQKDDRLVIIGYN